MRWTAAVVMLSLLAGCAQTPESPGTCPEGGPTGGDCGFLPQAGQLLGVVVDDAIIPIPDATASLPSLGLTASTDASGRFQFDELEPGTYAITVTAPLYDTVQVTGIVPAQGGAETLRVQLTRVIQATPFIETAVFDGFLACSSNVGGVIAEECGEGAGVPGVGRIGGQANNKPFVTFYAEGPLPQTIQGEIVWDATLTVGNGVQTGGFTAIMATHFVCDPICGYEHSLDDKVGHSPLVMRTDDGDQGGGYFTAPDVALANAGITPETPITVFVWTSDDDLAAVTVEQPFTVYRTVSYVLPLPQEWSFARGDPAPF